MRCTVFQRLKLLKRLQEVDRSPDEAWGLLDRVKTPTSSAEDREQLAHLIRVTLAVTDTPERKKGAMSRQATRRSCARPDEPVLTVGELRSRPGVMVRTVRHQVRKALRDDATLEFEKLLSRRTLMPCHPGFLIRAATARRRR